MWTTVLACRLGPNKGKTHQDGRRAGWPENFDEDSGYQRAETSSTKAGGPGEGSTKAGRFDEGGGGSTKADTKGQDKARKKTRGFDEGYMKAGGSTKATRAGRGARRRPRVSTKARGVPRPLPKAVPSAPIRSPDRFAPDQILFLHGIKILRCNTSDKVTLPSHPCEGAAAEGREFRTSRQK